MTRLIFASLNENAGKTSIILGLASVLKKRSNKKCGYIKPFGDRLLYRKKRLWDYDSALVTQILKLDENSEHITLGFDHSKMKYMYDKQSTREKLMSIANESEKDKDFLLIECGKHIFYGASIFLDAFTMAETLDAEIILVASGTPDDIEDRLTFLKSNINHKKVKGIIINQIEDMEDFKSSNYETISNLGFKILGLVPVDDDLQQISIAQISDTLMAKVIAANDKLHNKVEYIHIGAVSVVKEFKKKFLQQKNTLIITSGDRSDIILESMDHNTSGIVLTNNSLPSPIIIAQATEMGIPLLAVTTNTHDTAKRIDDLRPLLQIDDVDKLQKINMLVEDNILIEKLIE